jgi:hypothetical protein
MIVVHAELALQRADLLAQADALERIERRQRLVEQQQPGEVASARPARCAAAGRPTAGPGTSAAAGQADQLQQLVDRALDLAPRRLRLTRP